VNHDERATGATASRHKEQPAGRSADRACCQAKARVEFGEDLSAGVCEGYARRVPGTARRAMRSEDRMKFLYVVTTGTDDPTKASLPLHLAANGSVEVGHDTGVLLAGDATEMLFGDNLEQMQGIGVPPVRELIAKLRDHAVPVYV
jgi:hypothetical protein